jgi:hypothetical protein
MKTIVFVLILATASVLFLIISNIVGYRRGSAGFFHRRIGGEGWSTDHYGIDAIKWVGRNAYKNEDERKWNEKVA